MNLPRLGSTISAVLDPLLKGVATYALVDFPNHANVGDSLIWAGERAHLDALGLRCVYACDTRSYAPRRLAGADPDVILIHGGGNFGDLWQRHQRLRERVVADHPTRRVLQLAVSVNFRERENLDRAQRVLDRHPDLVLLLRDPASLALVRQRFSARAELCPDMALALGPLPRPRPAVTDLVWLSRTDKEGAGGPGDPDGAPPVEPVDWLTDPGPPVRSTAGVARRMEAVTGLLAGRVGFPLPGVLVAAMYDRLAGYQVARGAALLSTGRVVVTDRLHAHVLCLLLGIPHVLLPDRYGKIRAFVDQWTGDSELLTLAENPREGFAAARRLLPT